MPGSSPVPSEPSPTGVVVGNGAWMAPPAIEASVGAMSACACSAFHPSPSTRQTTTWRHGPTPRTSTKPGTPTAAAADEATSARVVMRTRGQRVLLAVAWESAAANDRTCRTTGAPSAASETLTDRSSLLAVPV